MVWSIAITRIKLLLKNHWSWIGILLSVLILGILDHSVEKTANATKVPVVVVDEDQSEFSKAVVNRLSKNPSVNVKKVTRDKGLKLLQTEQAAIGFLLTEGFMEKMKAGEEEELVMLWLAKGAVSQGLVREIFASEVMRLSSNVKGADTVLATYGKKEKVNEKEAASLWKDAFLYSDHYWEPEPLMSVDYKVGATKEKAVQTAAEPTLSIYLPGVLFVLMLFSFLWNTWQIKDVQNGMRSRVPYRAGSFSAYWTGNAIGVFVLQLILLILLMGLGLFKGEIDFSPAIVFVFIGYVLFLNALSLVLGRFVRSFRTWHVITLFFVLITSLLSGTFFPSDELSHFLKQTAEWTPQFWVQSALYHDTSIISLWMIAISVLFYLLSIIKAGDNA